MSARAYEARMRRRAKLHGLSLHKLRCPGEPRYQLRHIRAGLVVVPNDGASAGTSLLTIETWLRNDRRSAWVRLFDLEAEIRGLSGWIDRARKEPGSIPEHLLSLAAELQKLASTAVLVHMRLTGREVESVCLAPHRFGRVTATSIAAIPRPEPAPPPASGTAEVLERALAHGREERIRQWGTRSQRA